MCPVVVDGDEGTDLPIKCRQVQHRLWCADSGSEAPGQGREDLGIDRAEKALDFAAALRPADGGMDCPDMQRDSGPLEVLAGEIGAVIDVQNIWKSAHHPGWILFAPDRLPK